MKKVLTVVLALPGILFTMIGIRWLVDPAGAAADLGMGLFEGFGRSSQIGDMASFFLVLGISTIAGVASRIRFWFYPGAMLLGFAAFSRTVSWVVHDATFAVGTIAFEVIVACLLWFGSAALCKEEDGEAVAQSPE